MSFTPTSREEPNDLLDNQYLLNMAYTADFSNYLELVEHLPIITYIASLDMFSRTLYISPQVEPILGFTQAEWLVDPTLWFKRVHPEDREFVWQELWNLRHSGNPVPCRYRMIRRDGQIVWIHEIASISYSLSQKTHCLFGVLLDITSEHGFRSRKCNYSLRHVDISPRVNYPTVLTAREFEVLLLIVDGSSNTDIANTLNISKKTVEKHIGNAYKKLGINTRVEAALLIATGKQVKRF